MAVTTKTGGQLAPVMRKLHDCRKHLKHGDVYLCLHAFKEGLEKTLTLTLLPADFKALLELIRELQSMFQESTTITDTFGPITFRDADPKTTLEFVLQLLKVQEQDMAAKAEEEAERRKDRVREIMGLFESGEIAKAKKMLLEYEEYRDRVGISLNDRGIQERKEGNYEKALEFYRHALEVLPDDEGIYYNIARVHFDNNEWEKAIDFIRTAMDMEPEFKEAAQLYWYLARKGK
ncbi:MAG: tetratricopeptide repeat protein [Syntrophales bacterium]